MSHLPTVSIPVVITSMSDFDRILLSAQHHGSSDIFLNSKQPAMAKTHGRNSPLTERPIQDGELTKFIELSYGLDGPSRLGASTPLNYKYDIAYERKKKVRFRVNATKSDHGYFIAIRHIPEIPPTIDDLNVEPEIVECIRQTKYGIFFVCGATGNGKSTLLSSIVRSKLEDETDNNIVTYEMPIEYGYFSIQRGSNLISQHEIGVHVESFSKGVINAMRQSPTVILVGESRDHETISASLEAATTGHQVFTTLHTTDVGKTFPRIISMFPLSVQDREKNTLIDTTAMIICQRLVPTRDGKRHAIREFIRFDDDIRNMLRKSKDFSSTIASEISNKGKTFAQDLDFLLQEKLIDEKTRDKYLF